MCENKIKRRFVQAFYKPGKKIWIRTCPWFPTLLMNQNGYKYPEHRCMHTQPAACQTQRVGRPVYLFSVWHEHAVPASDRLSIALRPEVTTDLSDCEFFQLYYMFVWRCPPKHPQAPRWDGGMGSGVLLLVFQHHAYSLLNGAWMQSTPPRVLHATKLNCCMTGLLLHGWRDFHLLSSMNHF